MVINLDQKILKEDGNPQVSKKKVVNFSKSNDGEITEEAGFIVGELTLKDVCAQSLLKGVSRIPLQETMFRYHLNNKINQGGKVNLSTSEIKKLKELINDRYEIILAGQALTILGEK